MKIVLFLELFQWITHRLREHLTIELTYLWTTSGEGSRQLWFSDFRYRETNYASNIESGRERIKNALHSIWVWFKLSASYSMQANFTLCVAQGCFSPTEDIITAHIVQNIWTKIRKCVDSFAPIDLFLFSMRWWCDCCLY